jgi:hypothetical protein
MASRKTFYFLKIMKYTYSRSDKFSIINIYFITVVGSVCVRAHEKSSVLELKQFQQILTKKKQTIPIQRCSQQHINPAEEKNEVNTKTTFDFVRLKTLSNCISSRVVVFYYLFCYCILLEEILCALIFLYVFIYHVSYKE